MKKILYVIISLLIINFSTIHAEDINDLTKEELIEVIKEYKANDKILLKIIEDKNIEIEEKTEVLKEAKSKIEALSIRIDESNELFEKIKREKKFSLFSDIFKPGLIFEANCKSTKTSFNFDTWYFGFQALIYKRYTFQIAVGYTQDFNVKLGAGFYFY